VFSLVQGFNQLDDPYSGLISDYTLEEGEGDKAHDLLSRSPPADIVGANWTLDAPGGSGNAGSGNAPSPPPSRRSLPSPFPPPHPASPSPRPD
ncbi:hypothetical protein CYMTET_51904, partial [Cymbomonas tetramitiformis]